MGNPINPQNPRSKGPPDLQTTQYPKFVFVIIVVYRTTNCPVLLPGVPDTGAQVKINKGAFENPVLYAPHQPV